MIKNPDHNALFIRAGRATEKTSMATHFYPTRFVVPFSSVR
jgi:hypothetical protein